MTSGPTVWGCQYQVSVKSRPGVNQQAGVRGGKDSGEEEAKTDASTENRQQNSCC